MATIADWSIRVCLTVSVSLPMHSQIKVKLQNVGAATPLKNMKFKVRACWYQCMPLSLLLVVVVVMVDYNPTRLANWLVDVGVLGLRVACVLLLFVATPCFACLTLLALGLFFFIGVALV